MDENSKLISFTDILLKLVHWNSFFPCLFLRKLNSQKIFHNWCYLWYTEIRWPANLDNLELSGNLAALRKKSMNFTRMAKIREFQSCRINVVWNSFYAVSILLYFTKQFLAHFVPHLLYSWAQYCVILDSIQQWNSFIYNTVIKLILMCS